MAIVNDDLRVVFLDEPLVPVPEWRQYFGGFLGSRTLGRPGVGYHTLKDRGALEGIEDYRFFTVICNPAIAILRWKNLGLMWWDQSLDSALMSPRVQSLFPQAKQCGYHINREKFGTQMSSFLDIDIKPMMPLSWPEDARWWDQYTAQQLQWMLRGVPEIKQYHYDTEIESILRHRAEISITAVTLMDGDIEPSL